VNDDRKREREQRNYLINMDSFGFVEAIRVVNKATQLKEKSDIHNTSSSHLNMLQCQPRQLFPGRTVYVNYGGLDISRGGLL
jgi:hypothetical protein